MTNKRTTSSSTIYLVISALLFSLIFMAPSAEAAPPDFNGGVSNEYMYEEYIFITGKPVKFSGDMKVKESERKNAVTTTYTFSLESSAGDKLTRKAAYVTDLEERTDKGQTTAQTSIKSYSEKITISGTTYTLEDYQLSEGTIIDNRPASDYYSGNVVGRKIYETKEGERVTIEFSGRTVGYENFWGATETKIIDYELTTKEGKGFITSKVSDSKTKELHYEPHQPSYSSFTGGHAVVSSQNMIGEYTYDIPFDPAGKGTLHLNKESVPLIERLIVPKFRDLEGNWSKDNIERLYSLGVFDESSSFFSPNTPMNRFQFTVGVLKATDIRVLEEQESKRAPRKAIFDDLDPKHKDYPYIESAYEKGISNGFSADKFMPNGALTRVQAVAMLVRALGMEERAPAPGYQTSYADNNSIPLWAKDSVYVATELGLVHGNNQNRFNPYQEMTRAEASAMLVRFLSFLEKDLQQNYRDDMLFLN
ncbi:S-layer homology domain-containing protein [Bacillus thermotolerans]|uniref:S-layer domain protein n=1 Tax=Bacillus thermotolerans TaxID=1221996 RepID=A0A0F5I5X5_BACTR|nr:S-layer homology domain-containing protein [Bacillus thermotolerans]KKB40951.1 S-layer domain protein [Bacillus thermotolerans]